MSWVTVIWSMVASACLTLAFVHGLVWWWRRDAWANAVFALTAVATALLGLGEVWMMRAGTPEQFATAVRWTHVPAWALVVALVGFVRLYLRAGRPSLAWTICGVRTLSLGLNFLTGVNLNYREITAVRQVPFFGEQVSVGVGTPNSWMLVGQLSLFLLMVFVADAGFTVWRQGDRRHAVGVAGGIVFCALMGGVQSMLVFWGVIAAPIIASLFYVPVVVAMNIELSRDLLRVTQLAHALRESERRMTLVTESAKLGIWIRDLERNEMWATEEWRALFGFTKLDRLDLDLYWQRLHPEDREMVRLAQTKAIEGDGRYEMEYRVVLPDGRMRWIDSHGRVEFNAAGQAILVRGVSRDISVRKRSEEALRESEGRFRTMADTAPVMIWISGADKLCTFFNKGWLDFTGRTLEQELGNGWAEGVHRKDFDGCLKAYMNSFDARELFTMEYRLRRSDGEYRWLLDMGAPRFSPDGTFLGYIGSCIDITERKLAEEAAHGLTGRLIQAVEEERMRLARELHDDLSQSLALLSVELEMFGQDPPTEPAKIAARMEAFSTQVKGLSSEVHQLSYELHPAKLEQLGLVAAVHGFCKEFALVHEMAIEFVNRDVPLPVPGDAALCLYRIAQEALHNVAKHSGGTAAKVELTCEEAQLHLVVTDDGAGFDPHRIRANGSLGLVSMSERARFVGGQVTIESHPGAGTRVEVRVPIAGARVLSSSPEGELEMAVPR